MLPQCRLKIVLVATQVWQLQKNCQTARTQSPMFVCVCTHVRGHVQKLYLHAHKSEMVLNSC